MTSIFRRLRQPGQTQKLPHIELLSRPGCHLCDDALAELSRTVGKDRITIVNITTDQQLEEQYVFRIPVVLVHDEVIAEGVIDRVEARRVRDELRRRSRSKSDDDK